MQMTSVHEEKEEMSRLIDADVLHSALKKMQKWVVVKDNYHNEGYSYDQVHFAIDNAPTVDAEPIRHGHWINPKGDNDIWKCSHCGHSYIGFNGLHITFAEMCDYCPCCGAKMDEVEE